MIIVEMKKGATNPRKVTILKGKRLRIENKEYRKASKQNQEKALFFIMIEMCQDTISK